MLLHLLCSSPAAALLAHVAADKDADEAVAADAETVMAAAQLLPRVRSTFKGNTEEMNGHVFQCFNECEDKKHFSKTIEALREYIAKKLKYPGDMASLTKDFVRPEIPEPTELEVSETNRLVIAIREKEVSAYCTRTDYLNSNLKTAYAVIWGQCSEGMKAKLTSLDDFETKSHENDRVWILNEIKGITYCFEGQRYIYLSLDNTQNAEDSISSYLEHFRRGPGALWRLHWQRPRFTGCYCRCLVQHRRCNKTPQDCA